MLKSLFEKYDIKYAISVDDCFVQDKHNELVAELYSEMMSNIEPFYDYLISIGRSSQLEEIHNISESGSDTSFSITSLIDDLSLEEFKNCMKIVNPCDEVYTEAQRKILDFLQNLKNEGIISKFLTLQSVKEAEAFEPGNEGLTDGSILWLIDKDFSGTQESVYAGLNLAKHLIQKEKLYNNYVYILTITGNIEGKEEDEIEDEFDATLKDIDLNKLNKGSLIYYINKSLLSKSQKNQKRILKSFIRGFKRKKCFELIELYYNTLSESIKAASSEIYDIKHKTLSYLLEEKVNKKGESIADFLGRIFQTHMTDEYYKLFAKNIDKILSLINDYHELISIAEESVGDEQKAKKPLYELREKELFNKHVNSLYLELSSGDIFHYNDSYFILVSQACDVYLRDNGKRKLQSATLLEIKDSNNNNEFHKGLSCFKDFKSPKILLQNPIHIPFDILDLCVINSDGQASLNKVLCENSKHIPLVYLSFNYKKRFEEVSTNIMQFCEYKTILKNFLDENNENVSHEVSKALSNLISNKSLYMDFSVEDNIITYPIKRICRLNELMTLDVIDKHGNALSRIGHPFDFLN